MNIMTKLVGFYIKNNNLMTAKKENPRKSKNATVMAYMTGLIEQMKSAKRFGTARNYGRARNSLGVFLQGHDIPFKKLDENLMLRYSRHLQTRGLARNSISFYMRILRAVYNKAAKERFARPGNPFRNVYTGIDTTRKRALDEESVKKLMRLDLKGFPALAFSRDLFLFSYCMRGMSFVDIAFLRKKDLNGSYIKYQRQKTGQTLTVLVEPCVARIIKRYSATTEGTPYMFPIISSSDMEEAYRQYQTALCYHNRKLKELARMAEMNIPLSSYCARHTWATAARNHNIPVSVISAAMGHNSEKTTMIYLASLENSVIDKANRVVIGSIGEMVSP